MHAVARHSIVNLTGLGLSGLIGLAVVGLVVNAYGLAAYGMLILVRLFLPGQLVSLFDCGMPETVTRATARGLASGQMAQTIQLFLAAGIVMIVLGTLMALPLVLLPERVAHLILGLDSSDAAFLSSVLIAHGLALPLLMAGDVAGSALKGQEDFVRLRFIQVATSLGYGLTALLLILVDGGLIAIALAYLAWQLVQAAMQIAYCMNGLDWPSHRGLRPSFSLLWAERLYLRALIVRRIGSVTLTMLPRLVLSQLLGAAAVGLFEAVLRVPRFLQSLTSVTNTSVMPVVVRLDTSGAAGEVTRLAIDGPRLLLALASALCLPFIALSKPFLELWMSAEVAAYWPWFAVLCALPFVNATAGFWWAMGKAELRTLQQQNLVGWVQIAIFYSVALPLVANLQTAAFWLALLASSSFTIPALLAIKARRYDLPPLRLAAPIMAVLAASAPAALVGFALSQWVVLDDWFRLTSAATLIGTVQVALLAVFIVRPEERRSLTPWLRRGC